MACIDRKESLLLKLIKYMTAEFDEVHILFHFNIILNTTGRTLIKLLSVLLKSTVTEVLPIKPAPFTFVSLQ